jgi:hypothetical protein
MLHVRTESEHRQQATAAQTRETSAGEAIPIMGRRAFLATAAAATIATVARGRDYGPGAQPGPLS